MILHRKPAAALLAVSLFAGIILNADPVMAQDAATIQAIQQQIRQLQIQLKKLQADAAARDIQLKKAQDAAQAARDALAASQKAATPPAAASAATGSVVLAAPAGTGPIPPDNRTAGPNPIVNPLRPPNQFKVGGVTVTVGGYVDVTGYYRSANESRGVTSSFVGIPFRGPTPQGDSGEFNASAQNTRLSLRIDGSPATASLVSTYLEADFNNGAGGANSTQTYSYTPRLRQAFAEYSSDAWQAYVLAGQAWNLVTPFKTGLDPFQTWQPPTLDNNMTVGYEYLRAPLARVVKGFGPVWLGLEADAPQTVFGGSSVAPTGGAVYTTYAGNGGLNPQTNYSINSLPDVIGKAAVDTAFGHYEIFGLFRQFSDQISARTTLTNTAGNAINFNSNGGGFGVSAFIPIQTYAELEGNFLTGNGIGRYGTGGLPDVTYAANGSLKPLHETTFTAGLVGHPVPPLDVYVFGGIDDIGKSYFGTTGGYGNPNFTNTGCFNPNATSGTPAGAACTGNTKSLSEITFGYNWRFLQGSYGTLQTGLQYAYARREAYTGKGGAPSGDEHMVYVNLRYAPFQ